VSLLNPFSRLVAQDLVVGLVSRSRLEREVIQEYSRRHPNTSPEDRTFIENSIRENHKEAKFIGTIHSEATLMGLRVALKMEKPFDRGPTYLSFKIYDARYSIL